MSEFISFNNVSKVYGEGANCFFALNNISFTIKKGEFVVILGPSGAGKSTLLNLLGGMDNLSEGEIFVDSENISKYPDHLLTNYRAKSVGFVFQFYNLIPMLTALENVALTRDVAPDGFDAKEILSRVGLADHLHKFPSQLSGGEQQRVSIARALCKKPSVILCDEPTGALDSETGVTILKLLHEVCKKEKKTVIVVTHNALLSPIADRVLRMKNGKISEDAVNANPISIDEVVW